MAEAFVNVTEGSGKKLWAFDWTVGANTVLAEANHVAPQPYPTFTDLGSSISIATATDHVLCLNAGASLKLRIVRIWLEQAASATAAAATGFQVLRTTTAAPTGGTAVTPGAMDTVDTAGATGRTLPAVKATESTELLRFHMVWRQAVSATQAQVDDYYEWRASSFGKAIIVPAGATNGIVIKNLTAVAGCTVNCGFEFIETAF